MKGKVYSLLFALVVSALALAICTAHARTAKAPPGAAPNVVQITEFYVSEPFIAETVTCDSWAVASDWTGWASIEGSKCTSTGPLPSYTATAGNASATFAMVGGNVVEIAGCLASTNASGSGPSYIVQFQLVCP